MSDFVELGNGPAPMRVTLVDGRDNALGLERRDDTGPVAWPSAPTLRLRDAAGVVVFDAAGVLSNTDTVASWTVPDAVVSPARIAALYRRIEDAGGDTKQAEATITAERAVLAQEAIRARALDDA